MECLLGKSRLQYFVYERIFQTSLRLIFQHSSCAEQYKRETLLRRSFKSVMGPITTHNCRVDQ